MAGMEKLTINFLTLQTPQAQLTFNSLMTFNVLTVSFVLKNEEDFA